MTRSAGSESWGAWADAPVDSTPLRPADVGLALQRSLTAGLPVGGVLGLVTVPEDGVSLPLLLGLWLGLSAGLFLEGPLALAERWVALRRLAIRGRALDLVLLAVTLGAVAIFGVAGFLFNALFLVGVTEGSAHALDPADLGRVTRLLMNIGVPWASASWLRVLARCGRLRLALVAMGCCWLAFGLTQGSGLVVLASLLGWAVVTGILLGVHGLVAAQQPSATQRRARALRRYSGQARALALLGDADAQATTALDLSLLGVRRWSELLSACCPPSVQAAALEAVRRALDVEPSPAAQQVVARLSASEAPSFEEHLTPAAWALGDVLALRALIEGPVREWAERAVAAEPWSE